MPSGMRAILYEQFLYEQSREVREARVEGEAEKVALPPSEDMLPSRIQVITQRPAKG